METVETFLHPGLYWDFGKRQPRTNLAQLRQETMRCASGVYALGTAQIVLGLVTWSQYMFRLPIRHDPRDERNATDFDNYFDGMGDSQMIAAIEALGNMVACAKAGGSTEEVVSFAVERLAADAVVLLRFEEEGGQRGPWVTAVGTEIRVAGTERISRALLCIDNIQRRSNVAPFNARLTWEGPLADAAALIQEMPTGVERPRTCRTAIAMSRLP